MYDIIYDAWCIIVSQVAEAEKELKMKIRPANAYFKLNKVKIVGN